ncbi:MAG: DEAD/DEAH box helicase [Cyclobacteriaceae bacterium]|nr:DEAD/DEAH box helicase [Cyclobacteriaceae bacterium]
MNFRDFKLEEPVFESIDAMGYDKPTPIQEKSIPITLQGKDLIACAQTGTGKTAAFLLPVISQIIAKGNDEHKIKALVITPTRELAIQIDQQLEGMSYFANVSSLAIYGGGDGMSFEVEKKALLEGADIIIVTPGRFISHLNLGYVDFSSLDHLILDEADRMLDMGFMEDIMKIINSMPKNRQTLMFSATMPTKIRQLAKKILNEPEEVSIAISKPAEGVFQAAFMVYNEQKISLLTHLLSSKNIDSSIIFSSTKDNVKKLYKELKKLKMNVGAIHSDLEQSERQEVLRLFKNRELQVIVATDVMARGIDIEGVGLVINYEVPSDVEDYIHRIGRTARADTKGIAFTFVNNEDQYKFYDIEKFLEKSIPKGKLPDSIGEGPIYDTTKFNNKEGRGKRPTYKRKNFKKK